MGPAPFVFSLDKALRRRARLWVLVALGSVLVIAAAVESRAPAVDSLIAAATRRLSQAVRPGNTQPAPPPAAVTLSVDQAHQLRPISPLIYGVSVAHQDELLATGAYLNRWGGNPNTRYNWANGSAWNSARDFEFRNYGGTPTAPSSTADAFVGLNRAAGVRTVLTIPAIGWVARNGDSETRSLQVPQAGGPPLSPDSDAIAGYDPTANRTATSVRSMARKGAAFDDPPDPSQGQVYQDEWVHHLVDRFGSASAAGVSAYVVDNEPDLWSATHTDVHPVEPSYDDVLNTFVEYAEAIKAVDPAAMVLGPAVSGWTGYMYSARDRGDDNFRSHADRRAHADMPFLAWWLDQVRQHDQIVGHRTLDALDIHYYPQAAGVFSTADDDTTDRLRLRSTRALWDASYVDESWIGEPVELIPRMRGWIDRYYPGTHLAINEWNWGADQTINGALAIADVLGIYGREGVDMAAYWTSPAPGTPGAHAFSMYTNYDGQGHGFGDRAVTDASDAPDDVSSFASVDSATGDLLVVSINKRTDAALPTTIRLATPVTGQAGVYRYGRGDPGIEALPSVAVDGADLLLVLPPSSITLVRFAPQSAPSAACRSGASACGSGSSMNGSGSAIGG